MHELQLILNEMIAAGKAKQRTALAAVVAVVGSAYRRPGARMLIREDGATFGSVSGGCLERDVALRAQSVIQSGVPALFQYSTTGSDDEIIFGVGAGCNGLVSIFIEPVENFGDINPVAVIADFHERRRQGAIVTVVAVSEGCVDVVPGDKVFFAGSKILQSSINRTDVTQLLTVLVDQAIGRTKSAFEQVMLNGYQLDVWVELIEPPLQLVICGSKNDTVPLTAFARQLGWQVTSIASSRQDLSSIFANLSCPERVAVAVMTHNYMSDLEFLQAIFAAGNFGYVGLLGPKHRYEKLIQELLAQGVSIAEQQKRRLFAPVGLDLGAETEAEIALAIIAEIEAVINGRSGSFLRDRQGKIHTDAGHLGSSDLESTGGSSTEIEFSQCQILD